MNMKKLFTLLGLLTGLTANAQLSATTNQFIPQENYGINYGFENGKAGHVASAGTFAITSTAANVARGQFAASMDFSATAQTLTLASRTIPSGLFGNNCIAEAMIKGGDANITMQVYDGTNVIASQVLATYATYNKVSIPFVCPSSGTLAIRFLSSADAAIFYVDDAIWGANYRVGSVAQSTFVGRVTFPTTANCQWTTASGTFTNFSADADCTLPAGNNIEGSAQAPATKIPAIKFASLKPGRYVFKLTGSTGADAAGNPNAIFRFHDGTNAFKEEVRVFKSGSQVLFGSEVYGEITYTSPQTDITIQVQAMNGGGTSANLYAAENPLSISVYYYPSNSETVYAPNMQAAFAKVDIAPAAGRSLTTASSTHVTLNNTNITAGRTNYGVCLDPTVAGDFGCRFAKLPAGKYLVQIPSETQGSGGNGHTAYRVKETVSGVVGQEGYMTTNGGQGASPVVGMLIIPSEIINANIVVQARCDGATTCGFDTVNYPASLEIFPVEQGIPMPVVLNSVQSSYAGQMRMETAFITNNGSSCVVSEEYGDWIASPTRGGTGNCAIPFNTAFSQNPHCVGSIYQAVGMNLRIQAISTSSVTIETFNSGGANTDQNYQLICFGPK